MRPLATWCSPGGGRGLDASVDMPYVSGDMPSGSVDLPSVDPSAKGSLMPSVGGEICSELAPSAVDLTGPDSGVVVGGVSLGSGLAAGVTAAVGAAAVGLCLSGKDNEPEGEVRPFLRMIVCCIGFRGKRLENVLAMVTVSTCVS